MYRMPRRQLYRCVFRMVGRGMVRQRAAMEAGWRRYIEQVCPGRGGRKGYHQLKLAMAPSAAACACLP